jgi:predicted RNA-binding protein with PIN domain
MAVYLVTWDLNKQKANYNQARQSLIDHLARYEHIKDQGLDSVWFISTTASADSVSADVRTRMDDNDRLIVTKLVSGQHQGWLSKNVWDWINARL